MSKLTSVTDLGILELRLHESLPPSSCRQRELKWYHCPSKRASLVFQLVKNPPVIQETPVQFLGWEDSLRRDRLPTSVLLGFPCGSAGKESTCNAGDLGLIPGLGKYPGEGNGYPLQYSCLENSRDCIVHGVTKSRKRLSDFHFH